MISNISRIQKKIQQTTFPMFISYNLWIKLFEKFKHGHLFKTIENLLNFVLNSIKYTFFSACDFNVHKRCKANVANNCGINARQLADILNDMGMTPHKLNEQGKPSKKTQKVNNNILSIFPPISPKFSGKYVSKSRNIHSGIVSKN